MEGAGMDRRISRALTFSVTTLFLADGAFCALEGSDPAPRVVRLAGSHPALALGAQDFRGNPGVAAAGNLRVEGGAGMTRPLGLDGLEEQAGWASWASGPRRDVGVAARCAWRGFRAEDFYRDDALFATFAWRWKDVGLGATSDILRVDYGDGDEGLAAGAGLGGMARLRDVVLGAQVADPSILCARPGWMREPVESSVGVGLAPRDAPWRSAATAVWRESAGWSWRLAQELDLPLGLDVGLGIAFEPFLIAAGAGWQLGWARLDVAVEGEPVLGWQTHVALGFAIR